MHNTLMVGSLAKRFTAASRSDCFVPARSVEFLRCCWFTPSTCTNYPGKLKVPWGHLSNYIRSCDTLGGASLHQLLSDPERSSQREAVSKTAAKPGVIEAESSPPFKETNWIPLRCNCCAISFKWIQNWENTITLGASLPATGGN